MVHLACGGESGTGRQSRRFDDIRHHPSMWYVGIAGGGLMNDLRKLVCIGALCLSGCASGYEQQPYAGTGDRINPVLCQAAQYLGNYQRAFVHLRGPWSHKVHLKPNRPIPDPEPPTVPFTEVVSYKPRLPAKLPEQCWSVPG